MSIRPYLAMLLCGALVSVMTPAQEESYDGEGGAVAYTPLPEEMLKPTETIAKALAFDLPAGWKLDGQIERYIPANLYDKINGRSELYMAYDVVGMAYAMLQSESDEGKFVEIFLYDMGSPIRAFGVYSVERGSEDVPLELGRGGYHTESDLLFWKGRFYVVILGPDRSEASLAINKELGEILADRLEDSGEGLWGFDVLPREHRVDRSVQYFLVDALSLDFLKDVFVAQYKADGDSYKAFVSRQASPEGAHDVLSQYKDYLVKYAEGMEETERRGATITSADLGGGYFDAVTVKGNLVTGVTAMKDRSKAVAAAADLQANLDEAAARVADRWSAEKANEWYAQQPWLVGCDFIPSTAINQLEMWQADTFDPETIDRELGYAASIGMNTARVYLHDLAYQQDPEGFKARMDQFLQLAERHQIRPLFCIFDDCWNADPKPGKQPEPIPGVHNSGWMQSPGEAVVNDPSQWDRLEVYVRDVVSTFGQDKRVLLWDLYNEPGNSGQKEKSLPFLEKVFDWARGANPSQPITAGVWFNVESLNNYQLEHSDVITFHNYNNAENLTEQIADLKKLGRPVICTEWMRRPVSTVETCLPVFKRENVACINWGLVSGKTQTIYPWGSPKGAPEPNPWFHDLFHADGTPYKQGEVDLFRELTGRGDRNPAKSES